MKTQSQLARIETSARIASRDYERLEHAVFAETKLPRKDGNVRFRGGRSIDWDKISPA